VTQQTGGIISRAAPLPRTWIDDALPIGRALVGVLFVAYSAYSTIILFAADIQPIAGAGATLTPGLLADRYWCGIVLAIFLFIVEIVTAEHNQAIYGAALVPDTIYTGRQMYSGLLVLLVAYGAIGGSVLGAITVWGWLMSIGRSPRLAFVGLLLGGLIGYGIMLLPGAAPIMAGVFAGADGYLIARFGEVLLFGKRRR
jgi:hypothetical protein